MENNRNDVGLTYHRGDMLFNESEMISDTRPTEVGERKQNEYLLKMAKEAITNGWLDSSEVLEGVKALKEADHNQDTYELSKDLEDTFNVDANFVDWIGTVGYGISNMLDELIKEWVLIRKPKPKFGVYSSVVIKTPTYKLPAGEVLYINKITDRAEYYAGSEVGSSRNFIFTFERLEEIAEAYEPKTT